MNVSTPLSDLARFVGRSERSNDQKKTFWNAYGKVSEQALRRPGSTRVTDLLGVVTTLSARTRRILAPTVITELDVFTPDGNRAVLLTLGED